MVVKWKWSSKDVLKTKQKKKNYISLILIRNRSNQFITISFKFNKSYYLLKKNRLRLLSFTNFPQRQFGWLLNYYKGKMRFLSAVNLIIWLCSQAAIELFDIEQKEKDLIRFNRFTLYSFCSLFICQQTTWIIEIY